MSVKRKKKKIRDWVINGLMKTVFVFIWFGWLLIGVGLLSVYSHMLYRQFESRHYLETTGTVTFNNRHRLKDEDDNIFYALHIRCTYLVDGKQYWSGRASFVDNAILRSSSAKINEYYPIGKQLPVFYDPQKPTESVLTKTISPLNVLPLILIVPFAFIGIIPILAMLDDVVRRLRWKTIGDYSLIEEQNVKQVLLHFLGTLTMIGLFVLGATMICIVFSLAYLLLFDLNIAIVTAMAGFIAISGVFGLIHAERSIHRTAKMLLIDSRNEIILFPEIPHVDRPSVTFSEILSFDIVGSESGSNRDKNFELVSRCRRNASEVRYLVVVSSHEESLASLKIWLENATGVNKEPT